MILLIDNYDSFAHNLARHCILAGAETQVVRNDKITIGEIKALAPTAIVISPGPCTPKEAGISTETVKQLGAAIPILGVCLGHQCIAEAYGGNTIRAGRPMHGKSSIITHNGKGVFENLDNPLMVGRYHSLITTLPADASLQIQAQTDEGEIMAFHHRDFPVYGVQFHPESILTHQGLQLLQNFLTLAKKFHVKAAA